MDADGARDAEREELAERLPWPRRRLSGGDAFFENKAGEEACRWELVRLLVLLEDGEDDTDEGCFAVCATCTPVVRARGWRLPWKSSSDMPLLVALLMRLLLSLLLLDSKDVSALWMPGLGTGCTYPWGCAWRWCGGVYTGSAGGGRMSTSPRCVLWLPTVRCVGPPPPTLAVLGWSIGEVGRELVRFICSFPLAPTRTVCLNEHEGV